MHTFAAWTYAFRITRAGFLPCTVVGDTSAAHASPMHIYHAYANGPCMAHAIHAQFEEQLEDCRKFKEFLDSITPLEFFEAQVRPVF